MDVAAQLELLTQNVSQIVPPEELSERLAEDRPLRVKLGLDPTAPRVTLGWAVVLRKLRQFQQAGHVAVLIVGDFTAQVGDPSGQDAARTRLAQADVRAHAESVLEGFRKILADEPLEIRYNSEWLGELRPGDILDLTSKVTVAQMLEREDFRSRFDTQRAISLMEFLYPVFQGMDSIAVEADIELGGTDQLWNLVMGRELQSKSGQRPQIAMTMPLLVGTDGRQKMSQSLGNYIAIDDDPQDMFGKVMSIPDSAIPQYLELATDLDPGDVSELVDGLKDGSLHAGDTKRRLGREIVRLYWGADAAAGAEEAFDQVFKRHQAPDEMPEYRVEQGPSVYIPGLIQDAPLGVTSRSEARRLISQGGVRLDGEPVSQDEMPSDELIGRVLQVGKRRFVRLVAG